MRVQVYEQLMAMQRSRRDVLKGAAGAAALAAASSSVLTSTPSYAEDSIVSQIMKIPGAGNGSPTDADWQKVGALCLGPTKANVKPGEFAGVNFSFMGLNNQNLHNFLFRGFLTPWEAYTGAKIKWIDLAQADYNARLQQSIATGTADFDILEMGAPFEGDMGVKDLLSEMPDWVKTQIDFDDYVNYLKPPVGTWNGKIHRVTIDSDCHTINYRTDVFSDPDLAKQWADWKDQAGLATWGQPKTWQQVQAGHQVPQGQEVQGQGCLRLPRPAQALGRFPILLHREPRDGLRQVPRREELAVRREHEAAGQQPGLGAGYPGRRSTPCQASPGIRSTPIPTRPRSSSSSPGRVRSWNGGETLAHSRGRATPRRSARSSISTSCLVRTTSTISGRRSGRSSPAAPTMRRTWPISAGASTS